MSSFEDISLWVAAGAVTLLILVPYVLSFRRRLRLDRERKVEAAQLGIDKAIAQFPFIDAAKCIGCGTCVAACPEGDVLGVVGGTAVVINGLRCIGHGLCEDACPVGAIEVGLGDLKSREDIPLLDDRGETSVPGVYIAGELGGMGLIRVAIEQGRETVAHIAEHLRRGAAHAPGSATAPAGGNGATTSGATPVSRPYDLAIVGTGPAGLSAALAAKERGMSCLLLDQQPDLGGSLLHYPRRKLVLTQPVDIPLWGAMERHEYSKEALLDIFTECLKRFELEARFSRKVVAIERNNGHLRIRTQNEEAYDARFVLLALGRRGTPRKLGVPGEELSKVMYRLKDAESYEGHRILVVGGGDSAVEAAMGLARLGRNRVTLSYRKEKLVRIKKKNQDAVEKLIGDRLIDPLFGSTVTNIGPDSVSLRIADGSTREIANDYVFVFIGGEPPFGLLHQSGVRFGGDSASA